ncbi:MAG: L-seryl-tRNA(Sec) selenium transferase [Anaerolineales bacterium]
MSDLRSLPSVDKLLQTETAQDFVHMYGRSLTVHAIRFYLEQLRHHYQPDQSLPDTKEILSKVQGLLEEWVEPSLLPVINATGVVLHTNLGRAPISKIAMQYTQEIACHFSNLEFDLGRGKRGSRLFHAENLLTQLTGAEAALVVNNNAAAVMLVLAGLAAHRFVVISRTQLVEIGGGFRVPDVMKQSGAKLLEIGTTNRVHLSDYEESLQQNPALFLIAHRSNFQIVGFTSEPERKEIAVIAHQYGIPLVDDLGSGTLLDTARYGLAHEPMVQESLRDGADIVCFSGDKLLGGPQAGIIVGKKELVEKLRRHPLARAIRADKMALSALTATLLHYVKGEAEKAIPVWHMIALPSEVIHQKALEWQRDLAETGIECDVVKGESTIGGGSLPGETLPTYLLAIKPVSPTRFLKALREYSPPIVARTQNDQIVFDPRTIFPEEEEILLNAIRKLSK